MKIRLTALIFSVLVGQTWAQIPNKFNVGISTPFYFGTARFGDLLQYANERNNFTGKDALSFRPSSTGLGLFGELEFDEQWTFDFYWQRYSHTTNFGKSGVDGGAKAQYKMRHGIIGVGASRKAFQIKGHQIWAVAGMSGGSRSFFYRNEGDSFSKERTANGRLFIAHTEAPLYFNLALSPRFAITDKVFLSAKVGYEIELMRGDAKRFYGGLEQVVLSSYGGINDNTTKTYVELRDKSMNRLFLELRAGVRLGSGY